MKGSVIIVGLVIACGGVGASPSYACTWNVVVQDLPTVETVMNNAVKAVGGREALDKVKTLHTVMAMNSSGQAAEMDSSWSRKGGRLVKMKVGQMDMAMGSDGTTAWMKSPMGYMLASEEQKGQINQAAMHMNMLDPTCRDKEDMDSVKVVGKESFADKDCYKLSYTRKGTPGFFFFDADSGLPMGSVQEDGDRKSTTVLSDWKKVGGVLFFHAIKFESTGAKARGGMNGDFKVTLIEVNTLDDGAFALPEEVKKLAADRKPDSGSPAAADEIKLSDLTEAEQKEAKQMTQSLGSMDVKMLKQMETGIGMSIDHLPEGGKKKVMKYYVQEIRKEIAKRGK